MSADTLVRDRATTTRPGVLTRAWRDRRVAAGAAIALVAAAAVMTAVLTPRGPLTTGEALVTMVGAVGLGLAVGLLLGTRWAMLLAPVGYVIVFELSRMGAAGPTGPAAGVAAGSRGPRAR